MRSLFLFLLSIPMLAADGPYDITPMGATQVYAGHEGFLPFTYYCAGGTSGDNYLHFVSLTGLPSGATASIFHSLSYAGLAATDVPRSPHAGEMRAYRFNYESDVLALRITATAEAAPGNYTLTLATHDSTTRSATTTFQLTILPQPPASYTEATYFPPIPGKANWRGKMESEGTRFCNDSNKAQVFGFGNESQLWYYDGARVMYQVYDATAKEIYRQCAENVASQYADFVNDRPGCSSYDQAICVNGWRQFTRGLHMAYDRTGTAKYSTAAARLARYGTWNRQPGGFQDGLIREVAYALDSLVTARQMDGATYDSQYAAKAAVLVGQLISMFETLTERGTYSVHQTFYDGLAAHALIDYYRFVTPDPRIPPTIRKLLDWTWAVAWDDKQKALVYNPDGVPWTAHNNLVGLVVPAFAWYYRLTGDQTYLLRGDDIFTHMFDEEIYSAKQYSQSYKWTFDYVAWRTGPVPDTGTAVSGKAPGGRAVRGGKGYPVLPPAPPGLNVALGALRVPAGLVRNNRITVNGPALAEGTVVSLTTNSPSLVSFYSATGNAISTVTVSAGGVISAYFLIDTGDVASATAVTITATAGELSGTATLYIDPPATRLALRDGPSLSQNIQKCLNQVVLHAAAPEGGTVVTVSGNPAWFSPIAVTVPAGAVKAFFCLTPTGAGDDGITMTYGAGKRHSVEVSSW